ncbi:MAG TPA: cysteine dioxygenase family protein [Dokdonella sp.]
MDTPLTGASRSWIDAACAELASIAPKPTTAAVEALSRRLAALAFDRACPRAPEPAASAGGADYRRHPLAGGGAHAYTCLLIAWPPAHRTPIHDHAGLWGIELVLDGALAVEEFTLGGDLEQPALAPARTLLLGVGDTAVFGGRRYAHRCRNLSPTRGALSLHVYGGVLDRYHAFHTDARGGYRSRAEHARVDATLAI